MDQDNKPLCSHSRSRESELIFDSTGSRETSNTSSNDAPSDNSRLVPPKAFQLDSHTNLAQSSKTINIESKTFEKNHKSLTTPRPTSAIMTPKSLIFTQPPSLFIQSLSQLNECSFNFGLISHLKTKSAQLKNNISNIDHTGLQCGEESPPESLTNAPPSYSFVLRQMIAHRRPRLMGTFIPSPSFIQHTPPPNYANAFDIYVDNPVPPPPPRAYNFSFASMPVLCPNCGYVGLTTVISKITMCTHLCAFILCILFCWVCVPLPYVLRSCKNVYHYCGNCRSFLGMYCPTSPDNSYR